MPDIKKHGGTSSFMEINSADVGCPNCDSCFDINLYHWFSAQSQKTKRIKVYCPGCKCDLTEEAFEEYNDKINEDNIETLKDYHDCP